MKPPNQTTNKPLIILDTNIPSYLLDTRKTTQISSIITELDAKYTRCVSEITVYELLQLSQKNFKEIMKIIKENLKIIPVSTNVLVVSALLQRMCGKKSTEDIIIAASSVLEAAPLLTANEKHFSTDFFKQKNSWILEYEDKNGRTRAQAIHMLIPNYEMLTESLKELMTGGRSRYERKADT